jgi:hypothetical protein
MDRRLQQVLDGRHAGERRTLEILGEFGDRDLVDAQATMIFVVGRRAPGSW